MKINVYVNYENEEVFSEKEYQEMINTEAKKLLNDKDSISEYCVFQDIGAEDIWFFSEEEKNKVAKYYEEWLKTNVRKEFEDIWEIVAIEI